MIRDKEHLAFIRSLLCVMCRSPQTQACHIRKFTDGGTGIKPSDNNTLPLCHACHSRQHQIGEISFYGGIDNVYKAIELANKIYNVTGNRKKAMALY